ncbi:protein flightless-1 homolog [Mya arenaria]|uniref:protein flightless-1 homolog n=1 Tax=Mya arenaria TaxID=6604 RepID=UPI0022E7850B|nr:protein flightless-1 homolog [Mya arenaria]
MAATGVLPFVRGIDLPNNDFQESKFPKHIADMTGLRWLKLNRTGLTEMPKEMGNLTKLEHLSLIKNNISSLGKYVEKLTSLRTINCRHNKLTDKGIPNKVFQLQDLSVVNFSHNELNEVPPELENAKGVIVLNLSNNKAFCAWEKDVPVDHDGKEIEMGLLKEYKAKLLVDGDVIPDPVSLSSGWIGEKKATSNGHPFISLTYLCILRDVVIVQL